MIIGSILRVSRYQRGNTDLPDVRVRLKVACAGHSTGFKKKALPLASCHRPSESDDRSMPDR
jgi:hypothetical protein